MSSQIDDGGWWSIASAPKNAKEIEVKLKDGSIVVAHWAQDLSGEEQPPFAGWFRAVKDKNNKTLYYSEVEPVEWRELLPAPVL